ncbi:hypothetical protein AVEN_241542-1 [Araneus ventricosus]|uniref:Uncharacterized protein n=1 Tax=Araneus ventricosus TaxID=182803 RepID=A0A4Y2S1R9_ARAVE|nr:hypothetical protein AVEN_241542-1 [Araneus ventricosus]
MQDRRPVTESRGGKSLNLSQNFRLTFICYIKLCIFVSTIRLSVSSELFLGLDQNPANPGIGVNYYGKIQKTTPRTLGNGLTFDHIADDFVPRDCSN